MTESGVPREIQEAYRLALYGVVGPEDEFTLKVGEASPGLGQLMALHQIPQAAFLTAYNPEGRKSAKKENEKRQQELEADLNGWVHYPGAGEDPDGKWDPEPSFLVLGIELEEAMALGNKYRQNAILYMEADTVPVLVLLR